MEKLDRYIYWSTRGICGVLMVAMLVIIFSQVLARYVFQYSLTWSEELGRYIFVWMTFLGMTVAYRAGAHVALDIICAALKGYSRKTLETINDLLVIALSSAIFYSGLNLFFLGMRQKSPALKIPMQYVYIVVPISGLLLLFFALRIFWLRHHPAGEDGK